MARVLEAALPRARHRQGRPPRGLRHPDQQAPPRLRSVPRCGQPLSRLELDNCRLCRANDSWEQRQRRSEEQRLHRICPQVLLIRRGR